MWTDFIGGLKDRGPSGVRLFTSDAHQGIKAAIRAHFSGTPWQRCQFHFLGNLLDKTPKKREDSLKEAMKNIWQISNSYRQAKQKLGELTGKLEGPLPKVADWLSETTELKVAPNSIGGEREPPTASSGFIRSSSAAASRYAYSLILRLFGALLKEQHEGWISGRRYLKMEPLEEFEKKRNFSSADPPKKFPKPTMPNDFYRKLLA